jgi:pyruvate formate lyase activating enzyme
MNALGTVLEVQRMSTEDGPGLRTTVFLKGCPLACEWCHNPESIAPEPEVVWHEWRCIGCRTCVETCPERARSLTERGAETDRERCLDCGRCVAECPSTALERQGRSMTVDDLVGELARDAAYYGASGGGITISGGEPTLQPGFVAAALARCRLLGMRTALDTCGACSWATLRRLAALSDVVLFDLKLVDEDAHRRFTGKGNGRILENLANLAAALRSGELGASLWVRTPLVPGATATAEAVSATGRLLAEVAGGGVLARWELCAFNNLCREKYRRLGATWAYEGVPLLTEGELAALAEAARRSGVDPTIVRAGGPLRTSVALDGRSP